MANFTSITGKKKDYSIADYNGPGTQKTASTTQASNDTSGTFTPSKTSLGDVLSGADDAVGSIAKNLPGITSIGAGIKSYYNNKEYAEDEAAAEARLEALEASKPVYSESDELKATKEDLAEIEGAWAEKYPDGYQSKYGDQISDLISKLGETEKFNYDVESDPLWNSIKDQYQRNALLEMQNAIGDAAGLTGGYGNSYAVAAGQQAYQQSISEMTDIIPELHDSALAEWQANRGALTDNLYAVMNAEDMEYSKWMDEYSMWANDRDYMAQKVANMSEEEFNHYLADLSSWQTDRSYYAGQKQQAIANQQWESEMAENRRQFNQQMAFNYINMGVGAAVDLTTAGMSAGVQLAGIGADTALGAAELAMKDKQFDASLAEDARQFDSDNAYRYAALAQDDEWNQKDYDLALKEFAENQRQFDATNNLNWAKFNAEKSGDDNGIIVNENDEGPDPKPISGPDLNTYIKNEGLTVPQDLKMYLINAEHYSDAEDSRLTAIETYATKGVIGAQTTEKLLKYYGYDV